MSKLYYIYFLLILIIIYIIYFNKKYDHFLQENLVSLPPPICVFNFNVRKLGEYNLGFIDTRADFNMSKPQYASNGWIFISNTSNWSKVTEGQKNELYSHIFLTKLDKNNVNVVNLGYQYGIENNVPTSYINHLNRNNIWINYYLKNKDPNINSSIMFRKCNLLFNGGAEWMGIYPNGRHP
jgi:hypothetical protein